MEPLALFDLNSMTRQNSFAKTNLLTFTKKFEGSQRERGVTLHNSKASAEPLPNKPNPTMKTKLAILITALTITGIASSADNEGKIIYNSKGNVIGVQHADAKPLFSGKQMTTDNTSAADNGVKIIYDFKGHVIGVQHADAKPLFGGKHMVSSDGCASKSCCAKK